MRLLALGFLLALVACVDMTTGTDTGSGGGAGAADGGAAAAADSGPSGTGCTTDPTSQVTLCERIDTCPGIDVDQGAYPGCGFRMGTGSTLDLECACSDALCPIGVATSCSQAAQLLAQQSALLVCQQASEGRCVPLAAPDAGGGGSGGGSCDQQCAAECGGAPSCLALCGC
jgi:hypothetical protein